MSKVKLRQDLSYYPKIKCKFKNKICNLVFFSFEFAIKKNKKKKKQTNPLYHILSFMLNPLTQSR